MICERCHNQVSDNTTQCPFCGTSLTPRSSYPTTQYDYQSQQPSNYQSGNYQQPNYQQQAAYPQQPNYQQQAAYPQQPNYQQQSPYQQPIYQGINVTVVNNPGVQTDSAPVVVEVLLSIFGIYGVGWLMAGETTTGILLLIGSFIIYWPAIIFTLAITFFIGSVCVIPLGIAAIIINAVLLNNKMKQKAAMIAVAAAQMPPIGPHY
ncbi:MAG TPA: hypothetical protein VFN23_15405 [Ktedonobacteraceae bacterium]|nr:hypothetical protein [Ktedonobacteraceae bacterium]